MPETQTFEHLKKPFVAKTVAEVTRIPSNAEIVQSFPDVLGKIFLDPDQEAQLKPNLADIARKIVFHYKLTDRDI